MGRHGGGAVNMKRPALGSSLASGFFVPGIQQAEINGELQGR